MKKIMKLLFGRLTLIGLAIILQVLLLGTVIFYEALNFYVFTIISEVLAVLVFLNVINRDMYPDNKIPWITFILLVPFFGVIVYLMFSRNRVSHKERVRFEKMYKANKHLISNESADIKHGFGEHTGQSEYIKRITGMQAYENTETEYYPCGEDFWVALLSELKKAEKYIFMEYFIIERGEMWDSILGVLTDKVAEGIEVRFMYDDIGSISKVPSGYFKKLKKLGIKAVKFNPFSPIVSGVHNNRDHRKITVIDGKVGFMGGVNLADEYINKVSPYGHWKDSAVKLSGEGVTSLVSMFLQMYDVQAKITENFSDYFYAGHVNVENCGAVQPFGDGPAPIFNDHVAENTYLNMINQAKEYLYITTPYLVIDHEIKNALQLAAARGVDVRIITPHIPDKKMVFQVTRFNYKPLMKYGVKIYEYTPGFIHAKNFIADGVVGVVGTINLDYRSLVHHFECGVWMYKTRALEALKKDFDDTFEECTLQTEESAKMGFFKTLFCNLIAIFTPLL